MADASLALAERRADDYKRAAERLGVEVPSGRQLRGLKLLGLVAPPASAGTLARMRGILLVVVVIIAVLALAMGIAELVSLPFGALSWQLAIFWGFVVALVAVVVLVVLGRRKQQAALAKRSEQLAARSR